MPDIQQKGINEFPQFWRLSIYMEEVAYSKTGFDAANSLLILDVLLNSEKTKGLALVLPDDPASRPIIIIEALVALFYFDVLQTDSDYFRNLKADDPISYYMQGKFLKGTYLGMISDGDGSFRYRVRIKDVTYDQPESCKWKIKPISSHSGKGLGRKGIKAIGRQLEESFGLTAGDAMAIQKSKMLFVSSHKDQLKELLRSMRVGQDDFEELFPMGSYSSDVQPYLIGRNPFGRDPILTFAPALDVAANVSETDKSQRLVLIEGRSKLKAAFGSLDRIGSFEQRPAVICLLAPGDEEELNELCGRGMDCWFWSSQDFKRWPQYARTEEANPQHPFVQHEQWERNLSKREDMAINVDYPDGADQLISEILTDLRNVTKQMPPGLETGYLVAGCHRLFKDMLQLPLSVSEYDSILKNIGLEYACIDKRILSLNEKIALSLGYAIPSYLADPFKRMIHSFGKLLKILESKNPKADALAGFLASSDTTYGIYLVCGNKEQAEAMTQSGGLPKNIIVCDVSRFPVEPVGKVLVTGWINRAFAAKTLLSPTKGLNYLLYPSEQKTRESFEHNKRFSRYALADEALRAKMFDGIFRRDPMQEGVKSESPPDVDADSLLAEILSKIGAAQSISGMLGVTQKQAHLLTFDDGSFTFLTKDARVDRLDRQANAIESCDVTEILPRDELIFTEGSRKLFKEYIAGMESSEKYKEISNESTRWWKALRDFSGKNRLDARKISELLAESGCQRTAATVQSWMEGHRIAPSEDFIIDLIAQITGDPYLSANAEGVKRSCHAIFCFHMKAGHMLIRRIIDAAVRYENDDLDEELKKGLEDFARRARVLTVLSVSSDTIPVEASRLGMISSLP